MRHIALIALALALTACASSSGSTVSYDEGNKYTCYAYGEESDVNAVDASNGVVGYNRDETDGAAPALHKLIHVWAADQDKFSGDESDPSTQDSAKANTDEQALHTASGAVQSWCSDHGYST